MCFTRNLANVCELLIISPFTKIICNVSNQGLFNYLNLHEGNEGARNLIANRSREVLRKYQVFVSTV